MQNVCTQLRCSQHLWVEETSVETARKCFSTLGSWVCSKQTPFAISFGGNPKLKRLENQSGMVFSRISARPRARVCVCVCVLWSVSLRFALRRILRFPGAGLHVMRILHTLYHTICRTLCTHRKFSSRCGLWKNSGGAIFTLSPSFSIKKLLTAWHLLKSAKVADTSASICHIPFSRCNVFDDVMSNSYK